MAPTATDPNDLRLALNPARRKALLLLVGGIVASMRTRIEKSFDVTTERHRPLQDSTDINNNMSSSLNPEQERQRTLEARIERSLTNPGMTALRSDALAYFERWGRELRGAMRQTCEGPEDLRAQQRRHEWADTHNPPPPLYSSESPHPKDPEAVARAEAADILEAKEISQLQASYEPITTRLTSISKYDRTVLISAMILSILSLKHYSAHSRVLLCYLTSSLALPLSVLVNEETEIAKTLMLASKALSADSETKTRQDQNASARRWKVGLASVAGAAIVGVTGGLAAPIVFGAVGGIMGSVGLGGVASILGIVAMNGPLIGSLFGAFGGKMTGEMVDAYAREVSDFKFLPVNNDEFTTDATSNVDGRRLRVTIGVNGWLNKDDDLTQPWRVLDQESEVFALRYEMDALLELGNSLEGMVSSYAWSYVKLEILKRTVLATLWSALWPVYLLKLATSVDNPFSVARNRSEKAGQVLADALINKVQGERPVTLIGYSLGSRVIYSCLRSLADRKAFGLIEDVILIGSPVPSTRRNWQVMRSVVSGKLTNVYSENDYILAFLYRATSLQLGVAGLQDIENIEGVKNLDLSKQVSGHLRYPELIGQILKRCGLHGVVIDDDEIAIDLPDQTATHKAQGGGPSFGTKTFDESENLIDFDDEPATEAAGSPQMQAPVTGTTSSMYGPMNLEITPSTSPYIAAPSTQVETAGLANLRLTNAREDSDSDDGGIQMFDNDSQADLQILSGEPEPDDDDVVARPSRFLPLEPKSLAGHFPKPR